MGLNLETIARVTGGRLIGGSPDTMITGAVRDSREVQPGCLFICIPGARVDGHNFASTAFAKGAAACLVQKELPDAGGPVILVSDTLQALRELGKYYRSTLTIPVIGVIGSVGKTTAKEMTAAALSARFRVYKTPKNLNNDIGVPLSLLNISDEDEAAVIEMGISDFGEMSILADMARPDIVIMTTIGFCHLEQLGDLDGVLKAKSEVFGYMKPDAVAVVSGDDEKLAAFEPGVRKITFGLGSTCDWRAENVSTDGTNGVSCDMVHGSTRFSVFIPAFGSHMVLGALPAAAVAAQLGETPEEIARGLASFVTVEGRNNICQTNFLRVIDDCYNANPNSVRASLTSLGTLNGRRLAILGDMKELGTDSALLHHQIGAVAAEQGIDILLRVGTEAAHICDGFHESAPDRLCRHYDSKEELLAELPQLVCRDDTVLVKASHSMGFDSLVTALKAMA